MDIIIAALEIVQEFLTRLPEHRELLKTIDILDYLTAPLRRIALGWLSINGQHFPSFLSSIVTSQWWEYLHGRQLKRVQGIVKVGLFPVNIDQKH